MCPRPGTAGADGWTRGRRCVAVRDLPVECHAPLLQRRDARQHGPVMIPLCRCSGWTFVFALAVLADAALAQTHWSLATPVLPITGGSVAIYDPPGNRAIVVNTSNTTWSVSSTTGAWTQLTPPTGGPGVIVDPAVAYDLVRQRVVLFGGANAAGAPLANTWELIGNAWQQPAGTGSPPARHGAGMCFDPVAGVVRLVAGDAGPITGPPQPLADVWTFDGLQWTPLPPTASGPSGPTVMVYDSQRARCVALA